MQCMLHTRTLNDSEGACASNMLSVGSLLDDTEDEVITESKLEYVAVEEGVVEELEVAFIVEEAVLHVEVLVIEGKGDMMDGT